MQIDTIGIIQMNFKKDKRQFVHKNNKEWNSNCECENKEKEIEIYRNRNIRNRNRKRTKNKFMNLEMMNKKMNDFKWYNDIIKDTPYQ